VRERLDADLADARRAAAESLVDTLVACGGAAMVAILCGGCAMLVGILKSPTNYNPVDNPSPSKVRRDVVLARMLGNEVLAQLLADRL